MIKDFDAATAPKANGEPRALFVDGHSSHYTPQLLCYAKENNIFILGYPSHCTHALQGLDVVCFARMKDQYRKHVDAFEEKNGSKLTKADFTGVFGAAFLIAFLSETIMAAFRVTGIYPFNPNAISPTQMKPSEVTSVKASFLLPQASPVQRIMATYNYQTIPSTPLFPATPTLNAAVTPMVHSSPFQDPVIDPTLYTPSKRGRTMVESLSQTQILALTWSPPHPSIPAKSHLHWY